jgi:diguanylate cyclase (GGDEF)-like protein
MADIDHFKKINDGHGHQAGDAVLRDVALRLRESTDGKGFAYRYGGEEFAVILPNHTPDEALAVAERARRWLEVAPAGGVMVTSSYGVATIPVHAKSAEEWVSKADKALYDAKHQGRNLVRVSGEPPPEPGRPRQPARKLAVAGTLSDEANQAMRLEILRRREVLCPIDQLPLEVHDVTSFGTVGREFMVTCPGCGFHDMLRSPERGADAG